LFFRGLIQTPVSVDTLISTYGDKFANPQRFFNGTTMTILSNGNAYKSSQLKNEPTETWLNNLKVEAENSSNRTSSNYTLSNITSIGSGFNISRGYYLYANPSSTSDLAGINNMFVKFAIPYTLSAKYNIYCVVVPSIIVDITDLKPNKLRFFLSYVNAAGTQINDVAVNASNDVTTSTVITSANIFITDPTQLNKILVVKNFQLPYSNQVADATTKVFTPTVYLRVNNAAKVSETAYKRSMRIDCIILEPVQ